MSNSGNSDGGCLSALTCGLLSRREKRPPDVTQSSKQADATVSKPTNSESAPLPVSPTNPVPQEISDSAHGDSEALVLVPEKSTLKSTSVSETGSMPSNVASAQTNAQKDAAAISLELWIEAYKEVDDKTREWIGRVPELDNVKTFAQDLVEVVHRREEEYEGDHLDLEGSKGKRKILWRLHAERVVSWLTAIGDIAIPFAPAPSSAVWSGVKVLLNFLDALIDPEESTGKVAEMRNWESRLSIVAEACGTESIQARSAEQKKLLQRLQEPLGRIDDRVAEVLEKLEAREASEALDFISTIPVGRHQTEKRDSRTENTCEWLIAHPKFRRWEDASYSSLLWLQGNIGTGKSFLSSKVIDRYCVNSDEPEKWSNNHDDAFAYFYCSRSDPSRQNISSILASYVRQLSEMPRHPGSIHVSSYKLVKNKGSVQKTTEVQLYKRVLVEMINSYPRTTLVLDALDECEFDTRRELAIFLKQLVAESKHLLKVFIASRPQNEIKHHLVASQGPQMLVEINTTDNQGDIEKYVNIEWERFVKSPPFDIGDSLEKLVKDTLSKKSAGMFRWTYLQWEQIKACRSNGAITERLERLPRTLSDAYNEIYNTLQGSERLMLQRVVRWVMCARKPLDSCTLLSAIRVESEKVDGNSPLNKSDLVEKTLESVCRHLVVKDSRLGIWKFPHASVLEYFENERQDESWFKDAESEVAVCLIGCVQDCCSYLPSILPSSLVGDRINSPDIEKWFRSGTADLDKPSDPRHPLQIYAQQNWLDHIYDIKSGNPKVDDIAQALKRFLGNNPNEFSKELTIFCEYVVKSRAIYHNIERWMQVVRHPAVAIIGLGLHQVLHGWWDRDLDLSSEERPNGSDLLTFATAFDREDLCEYLIERGCDLNGHAERMEHSAIGKAIHSNRIGLVKLFLDNGANPDRVIEGQSLLCLALATSTASFELLSERCQNVNIRCNTDFQDWIDCRFGCALSRAAYYGNIKALNILLDKHADVNPKDLQDAYGSPLVAAIDGRELDCVRFLISRGARVNAELRTGEFGTPLAAAASMGELEIARILVDNGAEVNGYIPFGRYANVLAAAILGPGPSLQMVKFLLEEHQFDLKVLPFVQPRSRQKRDERRLRGDQVEIVRYFIREYGVDAESLISLGIPPIAMKLDTAESEQETEVSTLSDYERSPSPFST
ncbi:hypothetical protein KAF25_002957 [Fusarium avenaceum]|uniref:Nephrocystin 3-like N-terminal domain-containing protein n=1 Tax=Fusarium avenaceum TaxID=40199 RepID=A0A9P7H0U6_9HYPO|nr:hypothetical protein KAF25_002957 [Fusarium avenaceum]